VFSCTFSTGRPLTLGAAEDEDSEGVCHGCGPIPGEAGFIGHLAARGEAPHRIPGEAPHKNPTGLCTLSEVYTSILLLQICLNTLDLVAALGFPTKYLGQTSALVMARRGRGLRGLAAEDRDPINHFWFSLP
jgi:hypothetical protein